MSYFDEIIADTPLSYWRHDEVGTAVNGDEITDSSGNNKPVTLCYANASGTLLPYGKPSGIETDASSRSLHTFSNSLSHVGNNDRSYAYRADSDFIVPGDFTLECWVNSLSDTELGTSFPFFGVRGVYRLRRKFGGEVGAANFYFELAVNIGGTVHTVVAETPVFNNAFYYIAGGRSGNAIFLQINKDFLAVETVPGTDNDAGDPTPLTLTPCQPAGNSLVIGGLPFNDIHNDTLLDECAIYDYALSEARRDAHYEAGINATLLNGYSNVVPSAILYSDEELPPISFPFRHNWDEPLVERISFVANNSRSTSGNPEGSQPAPTPRREIEISQILRDDSERRRFRAKLWAHQDRKWFVPMREDFEQLAATLSSGTNSIPVSPQYKDYDVDSWIGVREINDAGEIVKSEELEIQSLNVPTGPIITKTNLVNSYQAYLSYAYPVRRGYLERSIPIKGHTDAVEELTIVLRLLAEDEKIVPNRITPWTPTLTRGGYEVFDPSIWQSNDWTDNRDYDVDRAGEDADFEVGAFRVVSDTIGAEETFSYRITLEGRDKHSKFLGWFYAREGSLNYLWVPTMQKDFKIVSVLGAALTVEGLEYSENYALAQARSDIAFVYHDNTMILRKVLSFSGSPNETLTLDSSVPTQINLRSVSLLKFCQMDGNTLEIAKVTDTKWRFAWRLRELLFTP